MMNANHTGGGEMKMTIWQARDKITAALSGDVHAFWVGLSSADRSIWAEQLAYGEKTLDQVVEEFTAWAVPAVTDSTEEAN